MSNFGTSPIYLINPSSAETRLFWETRSPVFHEEGFRVSEPFQSWEIAQKMHICLCSPNIKSAGLGLRVTCLLFLRHVEGISRSPAFIYVYDTLPWETLHKHTNQRRNSDLNMTATLHANSKISVIKWFCYVHGNSEWIITTLHGLVSTNKIQFYPISNETLELLSFSTFSPPPTSHPPHPHHNNEGAISYDAPFPFCEMCTVLLQNGALWDIRQMHWGIFEMALLKLTTV